MSVINQHDQKLIISKTKSCGESVDLFLIRTLEEPRRSRFPCLLSFEAFKKNDMSYMKENIFCLMKKKHHNKN